MVRGLVARVNNRHGLCGARPPGGLYFVLCGARPPGGLYFVLCGARPPGGLYFVLCGARPPGALHFVLCGARPPGALHFVLCGARPPGALVVGFGERETARATRETHRNLSSCCVGRDRRARSSLVSGSGRRLARRASPTETFRLVWGATAGRARLGVGEQGDGSRGARAQKCFC